MNKYILILISFVVLLYILDTLIKNLNDRKSDSANSNKHMSQTEYRIAKYLDKLQVKYKMQYTFRGCKDKQLLPFDFAIINEKGKPLLLIEYDGEQHFYPVDFNGEGYAVAKKNFRTCKRHDKIKNRYCKWHHIPLLRIPYKENKNLYKIIYKELKQRNLLK